MLRMVTAQSDALEPGEAVAEVLAQSRERLQGDTPAVGIVYTSYLDTDYENLLAPILERHPGMQLIGCTTDGEFSDVAGRSEDSLVLSLLCPGERIRCAVGLGHNLAADTMGAARQAVDMAQQALGTAPVCCIAMPDGLNTFTNPVVESLTRVLGPGVGIVGGTAGDGFRAQKTFQFHNGACHTDALPVLLLGGELRYSHALACGWNPIGPFLEVDEARGPAVVRINNTPALELYKEYLGQESLSIQEISPFSLAVYHDDGDGFFLRAPASIDEEQGLIYFAGSIPQGARVRLTEMGRDEIAAAAAESGRKALQAYSPEGDELPEAVLTFSCTSRRQILGSRSSEEQAHLRGIYPGVPFSGFYTYGEICPLGQGETAHFHNGTFVTCCLGEA